MVRTVLLLRRPYRLRQQGLFVYGKTMSVSIADLQLLLDFANADFAPLYALLQTQPAIAADALLPGEQVLPL